MAEQTKRKKQPKPLAIVRVEKPPGIVVRRIPAVLSSYREVARDTVEISASIQPGARLLLILGLPFVVILLVGILAQVRPSFGLAMMLFVLLGGLTIVVEHMFAGRLRLTIGSGKLKVSPFASAPGNRLELDLARIGSVFLESQSHRTRVCLELVDPPARKIVAVVRTAHEARFIAQEIDDQLKG